MGTKSRKEIKNLKNAKCKKYNISSLCRLRLMFLSVGYDYVFLHVSICLLPHIELCSKYQIFL